MVSKERAKLYESVPKNWVFGNIYYDRCGYSLPITPKTLNLYINACWSVSPIEGEEWWVHSKEGYSVFEIDDNLFLAYNPKTNIKSIDTYVSQGGKDLDKNVKKFTDINGTMHSILSKYLVFRSDDFGNIVDLTEEDYKFLEDRI